VTAGQGAADAGSGPASPVAASAVAASSGVESAAASRGPLVMEAVALSKDFRVGRGQWLHAVRSVSFGLYRGGVVALVGESGSGKSTVARLLAGQQRPTSGSILLGGEPVSLTARRAFRRYKSSVQLVFQDPFSSLNPVHTVRYHLERPVRLHQGKTPGAEVEDEIATLMRQVRLTPAEHFLGKYPHELSGGQRQRVSFARALAARPEVLLADEPVSMLDVSIRLEMLALLDDLRRRLHLALLYITHDIASARYFADEVLVLYAGQVMERGPAEEVTQHPAHPYTQLLVASAPDPDRFGGSLRDSPRAGAAANGAAPALTTATGCPFSARCPLADDRCRAQAPALQRVTSSRAAACWRLDVAAPEVLTGREGGGDLTD
jgi:peptide/nickel transport system ATP-binding protein